MNHIFIKIKPIKEGLEEQPRPTEVYINLQHIIWIRIIDNSDKFVGIQTINNHYIISRGDWEIIKKTHSRIFESHVF
jgi:hypothetical protein